MEYIEQRYATEPYRLALSLLVADLAAASSEDMKSHLMSRDPHNAYISLEKLKEPVDIIVNAMPEVLAESGLRTMQRQLNIFGLQSARLDIRALVMFLLSLKYFLAKSPSSFFSFNKESFLCLNSFSCFVVI